MAKDHALRLGKLVANLQSLEALLRIYLLKRGSGDAGKKPYWDLAEGDTVDEDEFSNYDSLGQLVKKYNDDVRSEDADLLLDERLIAVRDLLAHGRVAATAQDTATLKILKFGKPHDGRAMVTSSVLMDDQWFDINILFCRDEILKVGSAIERYVP